MIANQEGSDSEIKLIIAAAGTIRCVYDEAICLQQLGRLRIERASHVEPDEVGQWWADLGPVHGPLLGPFVTRSEALAAETNWLDEHWLCEAGSREAKTDY